MERVRSAASAGGDPSGAGAVLGGRKEGERRVGESWPGGEAGGDHFLLALLKVSRA